MSRKTMETNTKGLIFAPAGTNEEKSEVTNAKLLDPGPPADSLEYFEVYEAFKPLIVYQRLLGFLPVVMDEGTGKLLGVKILSWLTLYTLVPITAQVVVFRIVIQHFCLDEEDELERIIKAVHFMIANVLYAILTMSSACKAGKLKEVFLLWQKVDHFLQHSYDSKLKRFGKKILVVVICIQLIHIILAISTTFEVQFRPNITLSKSSVLVAITVWPICIATPFLMPIGMLMIFIKAIVIRLQQIETDLRSLLSSHRHDLSVELQKSRVSFHILIRMMNETSQFLSPSLLVVFIIGGLRALISPYDIFIPNNISNYSFFIMRLYCVLMPLFMPCMTCFAAYTVNSAVRRVVCVLRKLSTVHRSEATKFEYKLFMAETMDIKVNFTASGYFAIDFELLGAFIGIITTHYVTVIGFAKERGQKANITDSCTN